MENVTSILDQLERGAVSKRLSVQKKTVWVAENAGVFPAAWFEQISSMGKEKGVEVPMSLFNWRKPNREVTK